MVGIWGSWVDMATFVEGVRGNVHQSFKSRAEAEDYYFYNKEMGRVFLLSP
jgi:viroplasmin and RNaseH domain-containing protein